MDIVKSYEGCLYILAEDLTRFWMTGGNKKEIEDIQTNCLSWTREKAEYKKVLSRAEEYFSKK